MKPLALVISLLCYNFLIAQFPVKDNANNGQMKRMVHQQWNDWQPTPETNWLGLPKDLKGWTYWRILHNSYYRGEDSRPYRANGPFPQNYASLTQQEKDDVVIRDSMKRVSETHAATYVSMSGGAADVAWNMYFGKMFTQLTTEINNRINSIAARHPVAASKMLQNKYYLEYTEYLSMTQDRLDIIHNSFVDRGERIVTYLEIQKELQKKNSVMHKMIDSYIQLTKLPSVQQVKEIKNTKPPVQQSDEEIIKSILVNFKF